jgi:hypothetical protein
LNAVPRPSARALDNISRFLGALAWVCQVGAATLYLAIAAQPAVWRTALSKEPASVFSVWGGIAGMTILWLTGLYQEQVHIYNRRMRRNQRKTWAVGHAIVLFFAAVSASANDQRTGLWAILGMGTLASLTTWTVWTRTKELPAEDQAVLDGVYDREAQQKAEAFDIAEKRRRRERLTAVATELGLRLPDASGKAVGQHEQPEVHRKLPSGKHTPVVYFLRNGNRIKIGTTTELKRRIRTLALRAENVALLVDGGQRREREFHKQFASLRIGNTEWFAYEGALADYIHDQTAQKGPEQ